ncbi:hypothetical protein C5167_019532 [Papaver somniferum]|uniref:Polygalacturonase n=1 Tax=Papaver somniferum TaxID=3469 RepID=A0A4Y7IQY8_PAPSO|nr:probable polygalacturonase At3g15720 [Papaver somniferum]RZC51107.1 hypothetical protein C5167_019532 [Papaver somniferum]
MELIRIIWVMCLLSIAQGREIGFSRFDFKKLSANGNSNLNVMNFGAVGNGIVDDSKAFLNAWTQMCNGTTGHMTTLIVPQGRTFLLSPTIFNGPCRVTYPVVQVDGKIIAPVKGAWNGKPDRWISFTNVYRLTIKGSGQIDGQGSTWWDRPDEMRPTALTLGYCMGCLLRGLTHLNSPRNHISIFGCRELVVSHVNIIAPENSYNTDGIDISRSKGIRVQDSFIGTGDDCVALGDGSKYINITNVHCGPGHGVSIGSLGANGSEQRVEHVHVRNVHFNGTMNGARIKTWEGGKGYAKRISFDGITLENVYNPVIIDQHYFNKRSSQRSAVQISDVVFRGIRGTSTNAVVINLNCSEVIPCTNIVLDNIGIRSTKRGAMASSYCAHVHGAVSKTSPNVPCLL